MKKSILVALLATFTAFVPAKAAFQFQLDIIPGLTVYGDDGSTPFAGFVAFGTFDPGTNFADPFSALAGNFNALFEFPSTDPFSAVPAGGNWGLGVVERSDLLASTDEPGWTANFAGQPGVAVFLNTNDFATATSGLIVNTGDSFFDFTATNLVIPVTGFTLDETFITPTDTVLKSTGLSGISAAPIPEPSTVALLAGALAGLVVLRRRRRA